MKAADAAKTLRCQDPQKVAMSWAHALGLSIAVTNFKSSPFVATVPQYFERAGSEMTVGNRVRLDHVSDDLDADATRLRELAATEVRRDRWHSARVDHVPRPRSEPVQVHPIAQ
jgi:hypothetical protein